MGFGRLNPTNFYMIFSPPSHGSSHIVSLMVPKPPIYKREFFRTFGEKCPPGIRIAKGYSICSNNAFYYPQLNSLAAAKARCWKRGPSAFIYLLRFSACSRGTMVMEGFNYFELLLSHQPQASSTNSQYSH